MCVNRASNGGSSVDSWRAGRTPSASGVQERKGTKEGKRGISCSGMQKVTTPAVPAWSPTAVLSRPAADSLQGSDGSWSCRLSMAVTGLEGLNVADMAGSAVSRDTCHLRLAVTMC